MLHQQVSWSEWVPTLPHRTPSSRQVCNVKCLCPIEVHIFVILIHGHIHTHSHKHINADFLSQLNSSQLNLNHQFQCNQWPGTVGKQYLFISFYFYYVIRCYIQLVMGFVLVMSFCPTSRISSLCSSCFIYNYMLQLLV